MRERKVRLREDANSYSPFLTGSLGKLLSQWHCVWPVSPICRTPAGNEGGGATGSPGKAPATPCMVRGVARPSADELPGTLHVARVFLLSVFMFCPFPFAAKKPQAGLRAWSAGSGSSVETVGDRAEGVAQQLRSHPTLAEVQSSVPTIPFGQSQQPVTTVPRDPACSSDLCRHSRTTQGVCVWGCRTRRLGWTAPSLKQSGVTLNTFLATTRAP